jgi:hypothetical protein
VAGTEGSKDLHEASKTIHEEYREKIIEAFRQDVQDGMHGMIIEFFQ